MLYFESFSCMMCDKLIKQRIYLLFNFLPIFCAERNARALNKTVFIVPVDQPFIVGFANKTVIHVNAKYSFPISCAVFNSKRPHKLHWKIHKPSGLKNITVAKFTIKKSKALRNYRSKSISKMRLKPPKKGDFDKYLCVADLNNASRKISVTVKGAEKSDVSTQREEVLKDDDEKKPKKNSVNKYAIIFIMVAVVLSTLCVLILFRALRKEHYKANLIEEQRLHTVATMASITGNAILPDATELTENQFAALSKNPAQSLTRLGSLAAFNPNPLVQVFSSHGSKTSFGRPTKSRSKHASNISLGLRSKSRSRHGSKTSLSRRSKKRKKQKGSKTSLGGSSSKKRKKQKGSKTSLGGSSSRSSITASKSSNRGSGLSSHNLSAGSKSKKKKKRAKKKHKKSK